MSVMKNYDRRIKLVLTLNTLFAIGCLVVSLGSLFLAKGIADETHKKLYKLNGTASILAQRAMLNGALEVEAKSHVELFHNLFFTLAPDESYINYTIGKAMKLIDESGMEQYKALKDKGFYDNVISTSSNFSIFCDSIKFDRNTMEWTYYGRQRIERRTSILTRQLITVGKLRQVPRAEDNSHGLIITNWNTQLNKDIEQRQISQH